MIKVGDGHKGVLVVMVDVNDLVGRLDQCMSEVLLACQADELNVVEATTLKHHAQDLIACGNKALAVLKARDVE